MHVVALGESERFGFNRNYDGFPKQACVDYHDTFVKQGHFFREHRNRDPEKKIGIIKASRYRPDMGRVELIVHGHKKEASDVYEKLKQGKDINGSMSCKIGYDRDNCTGKLCRSPADYESHMKHSPGQFIHEFQKYAFVHNDHPKFFDFSYVARPADRIAFHLDYDLGDAELKKAASEFARLPSAYQAVAEGVTLPTENEFTTTQLEMVEKLAALEDLWHDVTGGGTKYASNGLVDWVKHAGVHTFAPNTHLDDASIRKLASLRPATMLHLHARDLATFPFEDFVSYVNDEPLEDTMARPEVKYASFNLLPTLFNHMKEFGPLADTDLFVPGSGLDCMLDPAKDDGIDRVMSEMAEKFGMGEEVSAPRAMRISITIGVPGNLKSKEASTTSVEVDEVSQQTGARLAHAYGLYKIACVNHAKNEELVDFDIDKRLIIKMIAQNNTQ